MPLREEVAGDTGPLLVVVGAASLFLLLLTCTNVTSLLLSRGASRGHETALRRALGSGSAPLVRRAMVEVR